jgi:hypothetical protein
MLVPGVFILAAASVTVFLVREKLKIYHIVLSFIILAVVYGGGVYFLSPAGLAEALWLAALPLSAFSLLLLWYRIKPGLVSAAFFTALPPVLILAGYAVTGPFAAPTWLRTALAAARTTGYGGWTVAGVANFFLILACVFYLYSPANAIIKGLLSRLGITRDSPADEFRAGAVIGGLERWIAFALVLTGQYTALAFVIAAKSIARYKKINEDEKFGEYFLIGTLTSIGIALFVGIVVKKFLA